MGSDNREKTSTTLARIDERLKNLIDANTTSHKEIIGRIKELNTHVNEENQKMNKRITTLENHDIASTAERKAIKRVVGLMCGIFTILGTVVGILVTIGVI